MVSLKHPETVGGRMFPILSLYRMLYKPKADGANQYGAILSFELRIRRDETLRSSVRSHRAIADIQRIQCAAASVGFA